ncbi:MAG TPA: DUF2058 domain-containing protein [Gammaproteobacteria bacterium]
MAGSLKDQLLKAGLVSEKQLKQASHEKRKAKGNEPAKPLIDKAQESAKAQRDRELNRKRQEEAELKARHAQIKQIVEAHRLTDAEGDIPFNFTDGTRIKRLYLKREIQEQVINGRLLIVRQGGRYHLVRPEIAEMIRERNAASVITLAASAEAPAADDPYADYQVPDDLIW